MAVRRRPAQTRGPHARVKAAALPGPGAARVPLPFVPSRRSVAVGVGLVAIAVGLYAVVRETATFAVTRIVVSGAPPDVRTQVARALAPLRGTSLLGLDGGALERRVESLPTVVSASYDRSFPHTLHVIVVPETSVAVLHRGTQTWLVSARGRVVAPVPNGTFPGFARIWVPRATPVAVGGFLAADEGGAAARALALAARFPARIATAALEHGKLVFRLRSGVELRLGDPNDVRLKLAIARRALALLPVGATYLDVSVPGRPVAGANSQVSGRG